MAAINKADFSAGILFILFGAVFGLQCLGLEMGTTLRMGPGYFPAVLSVILLGLGAAIVVSSFGSIGEDVGNYAWRGMVFILAAPIFFGLTVRGLGFVPSIFLTTLIAALAGLKLKPLYAVALAVAVTIFCTLVFSVALGLPFRRFGPWLPF
ncbi:MAG: tripartite tricarboxylate transporter TctB family protein [Cypionkella sp.]|uniref:tripartite tricarboxylate transporter TctB family protein n=1 Tax=Cypionkella sp. TaxID=2811411 RepID=UPI002ABC9306|nr:tripartite tricarboxylate transporter TctB family protein [Cypionkella sp.]MDZ4309892.1 tripartite tricarboxylate transporter TctB family protein [Cypionkella sp.]MDZ4393388.1 tripartite tricarboxylate transporter TctB family protein [Cypionkella sp.]